MNNLERKFTPSEICDIMFEEGIYDKDSNGEDIRTFETVYEDTVYTDHEKSYSNIEFVIKDLIAGVFYKAELMRCSDQSYVEDENCKAEWKQVQEYTEIVKTYK